MTQKQQTTTTGQYNPASMGVYNTAQQQFGNAITGEINDPYSNMFFNQQLGRQQQAFGASGVAATQALTQRAQAMGITPNSPLFFSQLNQLQRQQQANTGQGFNNLLMQAGQMRQSAIGMAGQYRPLQTGQTQTQQVSGLGSWLPQVVGAGLGAAGAFFGGGMGGSGGGSSPFSQMPGDYANQPTGNLPTGGMNMNSPFWGLQGAGIGPNNDGAYAGLGIFGSGQ